MMGNDFELAEIEEKPEGINWTEEKFEWAGEVKWDRCLSLDSSWSVECPGADETSVSRIPQPFCCNEPSASELILAMNTPIPTDETISPLDAEPSSSDWTNSSQEFQWVAASDSLGWGSPSQSIAALEERSQRRSFKVVVIGAPDVGKTSFVERLRSGQFIRTSPSLRLEVIDLTCKTSIGDITLRFWVVPGNSPADQPFPITGASIGADAGILMFDLTSVSSYEGLSKDYQEFDNAADGSVAVLVANKADRIRKLKRTEIDFHRRKGLPFCEISVKSGYQVEKPLSLLLRKLTRVQDLSISFDYIAPAAKADFSHQST